MDRHTVKSFKRFIEESKEDHLYHVVDHNDDPFKHKHVSTHKDLESAKAAAHHDRHFIAQTHKNTVDTKHSKGWHQVHNVHFKEKGKWKNHYDHHGDDYGDHDEYHPKHGTNVGGWADK